MWFDNVAPKYWDEERHKVVDGVRRRKAPFRLTDLCGTYHWVWNGDPESAGEIQDSYDDWGCITLKKTNPSRKLTARNISGVYQMCLLHWRFESLEGEKDPDTKRKIPNLWKAKGVELNEEGFFDPTDDQLFTVSEVLDDNGHPFLVLGVVGLTDLHCIEGPIPSGQDYEMIAKKQRTGFVEGSERWEGLTDDEYDRLGMHLSYEEVKKMAAEEVEVDDHITEADRFEVDDEKPAVIKRKADLEDDIEGKPPTKLKREETELEDKEVVATKGMMKSEGQEGKLPDWFKAET